MLAAVLDMKDNDAALGGQAELLFGAVDEVEILGAREQLLFGIGVEREAVEILTALRGARDGAPLREHAVKILCDRAAHICQLDAVVIEFVEKMRGELLAPA